MSVDNIKRELDPETVLPSTSNGVVNNIVNISDNSALNTVEKQTVLPEFVSIKVEPGLCEAEIKTEPVDPELPQTETPSNTDTSNWHHVPVKYEMPYQPTISVTIKQEPVESDTQLEDSCDYIVPDTVTPAPLNLTSNVYISDVAEEVLSLNSTVDGKYMCPICHKRFANKGNVQRHMLLHTREKMECDVCFRQFINPAHFKRHVLTHSTEKRFKCDECGKMFRTTSNLDQHKKIHLAVKPFQCETCLRQFAVKANLVKHQSTGRCKTPNSEPIVCHVCNKTFQKEFLLKSHLRRHTTERPYICDKCQMSFKYKSTLIRHVQLHNGIKPYSCKICRKKFTHAGLIKPHMRKHTGEKPYSCPVCNKKFAHKHNMQRHTVRHAKIKHLVCAVCNKQFPKESRLIYHMRIHTNSKPFGCEICGKSFSHRQNIIRHYSRKHPTEKYTSTDTDASVAKNVWENVVMRKSSDVKIELVESSDDEVLSQCVKTQIT